MPTTVIQVERVDHSRYTGKRGPFDDYLVTGVEVDAYTVQFHTTSVFLAAVCQRAKDLERPASIVWRDHRVGKQIVDANIQPPVVEECSASPVLSDGNRVAPNGGDSGQLS